MNFFTILIYFLVFKSLLFFGSLYYFTIALERLIEQIEQLHTVP